MANHASALKRHRQSLKRRARNRSVKARIKTQRKKFWAAAAGDDTEAAQQQFVALQRELDRAAAKGILHKNTAARLLARAAAKLPQA